eukprot:UN30895
MEEESRSKTGRRNKLKFEAYVRPERKSANTSSNHGLPSSTGGSLGVNRGGTTGGQSDGIKLNVNRTKGRWGAPVETQPEPAKEDSPEPVRTTNEPTRASVTDDVGLNQSSSNNNIWNNNNNAGNTNKEPERKVEKTEREMAAAALFGGTGRKKGGYTSRRNRNKIKKRGVREHDREQRIIIKVELNPNKRKLLLNKNPNNNRKQMTLIYSILEWPHRQPTLKRPTIQIKTIRINRPISLMACLVALRRRPPTIINRKPSNPIVVGWIFYSHLRHQI